LSDPHVKVVCLYRTCVVDSWLDERHNGFLLYPQQHRKDGLTFTPRASPLFYYRYAMCSSAPSTILSWRRNLHIQLSGVDLAACFRNAAIVKKEHYGSRPAHLSVRIPSSADLPLIA